MMLQAFPKILSSQIAFDTARTILDGFDKHYRLFRQACETAKRHFERRSIRYAARIGVSSTGTIAARPTSPR